MQIMDSMLELDVVDAAPVEMRNDDDFDLSYFDIKCGEKIVVDFENEDVS